MQLLLWAKADVDLEGPDEQTPLFQAANGGGADHWAGAHRNGLTNKDAVTSVFQSLSIHTLVSPALYTLETYFPTIDQAW